MHTEDLEVGYLARPARGTHPGVLMLHDVWGLSEHTRDLARRLAAEGFSVLALALYRREIDAVEKVYCLGATEVGHGSNLKEIRTRADEATDGPASLVLVDPDGNPILIDQHVPSPGS